MLPAATAEEVAEALERAAWLSSRCGFRALFVETRWKRRSRPLQAPVALVLSAAHSPDIGEAGPVDEALPVLVKVLDEAFAGVGFRFTPYAGRDVAAQVLGRDQFRVAA
jgi:hypothetical protein